MLAKNAQLSSFLLQVSESVCLSFWKILTFCWYKPIRITFVLRKERRRSRQYLRELHQELTFCEAKSHPDFGKLMENIWTASSGKWYGKFSPLRCKMIGRREDVDDYYLKLTNVVKTLRDRLLATFICWRIWRKSKF